MKDLYDLETLYVDTTKKILHSLSQGEKDGIEGGAICPFVAQVGKNYENSLYRLMFIGKATNGWFPYLNCNETDDEIDSIYKNKCFNPSFAERLVHRDDEMQWVEDLEGNEDKDGYNTNKSAFWRVIKKVSSNLEGSDNWSSKIVWSNLYKFAPDGGNPEGNLAYYQAENCWKILDEEISYFKPKCVIFLTSHMEEEYLASRYKNVERKNSSFDGYEISYFIHEGTLFICSLHPQGKPEASHVKVLTDIITSNVNV